MKYFTKNLLDNIFFFFGKIKFNLGGLSLIGHSAESTNQIITKTFIELGFNRRDSISYAENLISETSNLLKDSDSSRSLIKAIASKGGTTEAALLKLKNDRVQEKISRAIKSAYDKSKNILKK